MTEEVEGKAILGLRGKLGSEEEDNDDGDNVLLMIPMISSSVRIEAEWAVCKHWSGIV